MNNVLCVCAVVDAQGFSLGTEFYVRELAIKGAHVDCRLDIHCDLPRRKLSRRDYKTLKYQTDFVHGLNSKGGDPTLKSRNVGVILRAWHALVATREQPFFACKNHYIAKILDTYKIPYVNLESVTQIPSTSVLNKAYPGTSCGHHNWKNENIRCAHRKVHQIWRCIIAMTFPSGWGALVSQTPPL